MYVKARHIHPSLVLVHPRKTRPCLTERLLMGRKKSNQTKYELVRDISVHKAYAQMPLSNIHAKASNNVRIESELDQEILQSQTADKPEAS